MKLNYLLFFLISWQIICANSAQPGFWRSGGSSTFSLLFPEDKEQYQKIQMVKELVTIRLYDGFAVVKGTYWMYNHSDEKIKIKAGYPINSIFEAEKHASLTNIEFDSLYKLEVKINGSPQMLLKQNLGEVENHKYINNWYVWANSFIAKDTTQIQVYFLVKTQAKLSLGYSKEITNAFIYLLESGSTWKQPIIDGTIQIQLADELELKSINGIDPDSIFLWNEKYKLLRTNFKNISPTPENNIIVNFEVLDENFDFSSVLDDYRYYFTELDKLEKIDFSQESFTSYTFKDPFEIQSFSLDLFSVIYYGIIFLFWICVFLIVYILIKALKKRRKK